MTFAAQLVLTAEEKGPPPGPVGLMAGAAIVGRRRMNDGGVEFSRIFVTLNAELSSIGNQQARSLGRVSSVAIRTRLGRGLRIG